MNPVIGIPHIDHEHDGLFHLVAKIHLALSSGALEVAFAQARALAEASMAHLKGEEELLDGWEGRDDHKIGHDRLDNSLKLFFMRYPNLESLHAQRAGSDLKALADYAESWLRYHIKFEDVLFVPWLNRQAASILRQKELNRG